MRLAQIDAPVKRQAFDAQSRQVLAGLVLRKAVRVTEAGRDRYGRVIGTVCVGDLNVTANMVREGMAWVYRQYSKDRVLYELESQAKERRQGLWADPCPLARWHYRRGKREQSEKNRLGHARHLQMHLAPECNQRHAICQKGSPRQGVRKPIARSISTPEVASNKK